ncbi:MAG: type II toxin-antitoxin system Phd/YefM family antitoxin [Terracidiphilus sp.]|jgi:prevent-host-death family protein
MRYSTQIKPISYVKAHAAELLDRITQEREPIIITQNGEARAVLMDVHSYESTQETMALLKILALGRQQIEAGQTEPLADAVARIRSKILNRDEASKDFNDEAVA